MKQVIHPVPYQLGANGKCETPCPHGVHFGEEDFRLMKQLMGEVFPKFKFDKVIKVGSGFCEDCEYFRGHNEEQRFVLCCYDSDAKD